MTLLATATADATGDAPRYRPLPPDRPADDLETELLAQWTTERLFERSLEARAGATIVRGVLERL